MCFPTEPVKCLAMISVGKDGKESPLVVNTSIHNTCFSCSSFSSERIVKNLVFFLNYKRLIFRNNLGRFKNYLIVERMDKLGLMNEVNSISCGREGKLTSSSELIPSKLKFIAMSLSLKMFFQYLKCQDPCSLLVQLKIITSWVLTWR